MWAAGCTEPEYEKCPETAQLKYGQTGASFSSWTGPKTLQRDCEYAYRIDMASGAYAAGSFIVAGDDRLSVPVPPASALVDISTVTLVLGGKQAIIPYAITVSSAGDRAVVVTGRPK
jgi:hypothetical protein